MKFPIYNTQNVCTILLFHVEICISIFYGKTGFYIHFFHRIIQVSDNHGIFPWITSCLLSWNQRSYKTFTMILHIKYFKSDQEIHYVSIEVHINFFSYTYIKKMQFSNLQMNFHINRTTLSFINPFLYWSVQNQNNNHYRLSYVYLIISIR